MVDVLGQPILEFNWNFHLTTGNRERDNLIRDSVKHDEFERMGGGKIAIIWGRTIQNAAKRKGIQNVDITFDQEVQLQCSTIGTEFFSSKIDFVENHFSRKNFRRK